MNAPEEIRNVSRSIFSISRYYGACKAFGHTYFYDPVDDVLIRSDVLANRKRAKVKSRLEAQKAKRRLKALRDEYANLFKSHADAELGTA